MSGPDRSPGSLAGSSEAGSDAGNSPDGRTTAGRRPMAMSLRRRRPRICPTWPAAGRGRGRARWAAPRRTAADGAGSRRVSGLARHRARPGRDRHREVPWRTWFAAARTAVAGDEPVVIATATLALQRQLIEKDLPVVARALAEPLGREPQFAVLKGRSNYLCLDRLNRGSPDPDEAALFDTPDHPAGPAGRTPAAPGRRPPRPVTATTSTSRSTGGSGPGSRSRRGSVRGPPAALRGRTASPRHARSRARVGRSGRHQPRACWRSMWRATRPCCPSMGRSSSTRRMSWSTA